MTTTFRAAVFGLSILALVIAYLALAATAGADPLPTLTTDKPDYAPEETVHISGTDFAPDVAYDMPVIRPDGSIVKGDGTFLPGWDTTTSASDGTLLYDYILNGISGTYEARAYLSPWSGDISEPPIAAVTFTDGNVRIRSNAASITFTLTWTEHSGTTCAGSATDSGTETAVGFAGGDRFTKGVGSTESIRLTAATTSDQGGAFVNWTAANGTDPFTVISTYVICVSGQFTGTREYVANYAGNDSIEWEKRDDLNALQGGATFTISPNPNTGSGSLTVVDNGANDVDPDAGQIKVTGFFQTGSYTVTETVAPTGFALDDDVTRSVAITSGSRNPVIGTQGSDDAGNTDESDFHNRLGTLEWEKRTAVSPFPLVGGAAFTVSPNPFSCHGGADPGAIPDDTNGTTVPADVDKDPDPGQFRLERVCLAAYTITETTPPPGFALDTDTTRAQTVSSANLTAVVGTQGSNQAGTTDESDFHNAATTAQFLVNKDFIPNSAASVTVSLTCTSGTVVNDDTTASEADPANFTVNGFTTGATCTATEAVPGGYSANQAACVAVGISNGNTSSCTITNTAQATLTVSKAYSNGATGAVTVSVSCTSGTPAPASASASPGSPAVFTITGFSAGATCTASESPVPTGYVQDNANCTSVAISAGASASCTITNKAQATVTVSKVYSDGNTTPVMVTLTCTSGTVSPAGPTATPAVFTVTGFSAGATCTASESPVPTGYLQDNANCTSVAISAGASASCTITNNAQATVTVSKVYSDGNTTPVMVTLTCTSGTVSPAGPTATPAVFTVTGFSAGTTCDATEGTPPSGYVADESDCEDVAISAGASESCTITNNAQATVTVSKVYSDGNTTPVMVTLTCTSGTVSPAGPTATPAVFTVTGFSAGTTCDATEGTPPSGYVADESDCEDVAISAGASESCTITNNAQATVTVSKVYSDGNTTPVMVTLTCTSGTVSPAGPTATPAVFTVTGFSAGTTCDATEGTPPSGYVADESDCEDVAISAGASESCTITNNARATLTVSKSYTDGATGAVTVSVTCTSGTVTPASASVSPGSPATFTVVGLAAGASCSASESPVPGGYEQDNSNCQSIPMAAGNAKSCTILNKAKATLTVSKSYTDGATGAVTVSVTCTSGTVTPASASVSPGSPATFTVTSLGAGATCTASESPTPGGYVQDNSNCQSIPMAAGNAKSCTITNKAQATITVSKVYSDANTNSVTVLLSCTSGGVSPATATVSPGSPATFTVTGFAAGTYCWAMEWPVPAGYAQDNANCTSVTLTAGAAKTCTIKNKARATLTVSKSFADNNPMSVSVTVTCTGSPVTITPSATQTISGSSPKTFIIVGLSAGATCTAAETVPAGYTANQTACANLSMAAGNAKSCTIINTPTVPDECAGMVFDYIFYGTSSAENIVGTQGRDLIFGFGGNDTLKGENGDDCLVGGEGDDTLLGDGGNDVLVGGNGVDYLGGGWGDDKMYGGAGVDTLWGHQGNDYMDGGDDGDYMWGNEGNDRMIGGGGDDTMDGGANNDTMSGGLGNDTMYGGAGDDTMCGDDGADHMDGQDGNDKISGGVGNDNLIGGNGNDTIDGGTGTNTTNGGAGTNTIGTGLGIVC